MISVLIPVYNYDIRKLVRDIHQQATETGRLFEIRCYDDGSEESFRVLNKDVLELPHVIYKDMEQNLGRAAIRNRLGREAEYEYLLFMDCDSEVPSPHYVQHYIDTATNGVVYGGRSYDPTPPEDSERYFRWFYGTKREQTTAEQREYHPYASFMTNNFMISMDVFTNTPFDEEIKGYGHEDTVFGIELKAVGMPIYHINNPLVHKGLETFDEFIAKSENALRNLVQLVRQPKYRGLRSEVSLLRAYGTLKNFMLLGLMRWYYRKQLPTIMADLSSRQPSLWKFQLWKLGKLDEMMRQQ